MPWMPSSGCRRKHGCLIPTPVSAAVKSPVPTGFVWQGARSSAWTATKAITASTCKTQNAPGNNFRGRYHWMGIAAQPPWLPFQGRRASPRFPPHRVGAARMSRLTWFTLCAITWFTPSVVGVYQKVSSFKCVNTFVNVNPPYAEFSKNQGNLSLGTGFTHSDFFSTKSFT